MNICRLLRPAFVVRPGVFYRDVKFYCKQQPRSHPIAPKTSKFGDGGLFMLFIPVTTFCLGTWQIKRRQQKLEKIQYLDDKTNAPPIPLPATLEEIEMLEYRKVLVRGTFDYSKEMVIAPRHDVHAISGTPGNMQKTSNIGGYVVVPFKVADSDKIILVNRGFILRKNFSSDTRLAGQIHGEVELTGVVRKSEKRNMFMSKNATDPVKRGFWMYRDIELMAQLAETEPIYLDADCTSTVPGGPVGGQTIVQLRNEHLSYILTWYSLSAITFYMWRKRYYSKAVPDRAIDYVRKQAK